MKRITHQELNFVASKIMEEIDLHFKIKKVLSENTNTDFNFWNVKEYDVLLELNHYCNLHDLTFCNEDVMYYHKVLMKESRLNYCFRCVIKNYQYGVFFIEGEN